MREVLGSSLNEGIIFAANAVRVFKLVWDTPKFSKRKTETFIIFASPQRLVASESSNFYTSSTMLDNLLLQIKFSKE